nr:uncharacterized protein LOC109155302 [Ipomoea batatas]
MLTTSPFTTEIIEYRAPVDIKILEHATFDGTGDPREHLVSYQAKMQVLGVEEPFMCKAFLPTLKGLAQKWFLALPSRSIRCFNDLADRFLTHYAKEVQTIERLDEQVVITFFMEYLHAGKLFIDLHNDRPKTYVEAIQSASRQADTEEAVGGAALTGESLATENGIGVRKDGGSVHGNVGTGVWEELTSGVAAWSGFGGVFARGLLSHGLHLYKKVQVVRIVVRIDRGRDF